MALHFMVLNLGCYKSCVIEITLCCGRLAVAATEFAHIERYSALSAPSAYGARYCEGAAIVLCGSINIALFQMYISNNHHYSPLAGSVAYRLGDREGLLQIIERALGLTANAHYRAHAAKGFAFISRIPALAGKLKTASEKLYSLI